MITKLELSVRQASPEDKQKLANLIHFETLVHRHLDWRPPLDWIEDEPFLILEENNRLVSALACPPDPPDVVWIRLFVIKEGANLSASWSRLWSRALQLISPTPDVQVAAIPLQPWFQNLLKKSGFREISRVVMMIWDSGFIPENLHSPAVSIRPMNVDDLSEIEKLDKSAFGPLWHNSRLSLKYAFQQAAIASTAELGDKIVGYQISTSMHMGGHLARLATHPEYQRQGIGSALLNDLLTQLKQRGATRITVNTQQENQASISLYEKFGFKFTGELYPVYRFLPD
jgi:ribosomal protein S18 acetylase RimI-like enzyme